MAAKTFPKPLSLGIRFFGRFIIIYALLIAPWPGWDRSYGAYFCHLGEIVFSHDTGKRLVLFQPHIVGHGFSTLDTRLTLGNRALAGSDGEGPVVNVDLDTRSIGWIPTALTAALILATPLSWPRRMTSLGAGLVVIQAFILFSIGVWIWDKSADVALISRSPFWNEVMANSDYALIDQLGASISVPVLVWILVSFRKRDFNELSRNKG